MAILLSCRGITKMYGELSVLHNIDLDINNGERIGLVGRNGAGKTTLADIIYGSLEADKGGIVKHKKALGTAYLRQVNEDTEYGNSHIWLNSCLGVGSEFGRISSHLGTNYLSHLDEGQAVNLSGGEKTKLSLARIWSFPPDLLILDEPTNNLDIQGMDWLVEELRKYQGTALIISHDRYLLDQTVGRIVEIEDGILHNYLGNYSFYREEKRRRYESRLHEYEMQEKTRQAIADNIDQLSNWSAKAHREARAKAAAIGIKKGGKEYLRAKAKKMDQSVKSKIKRLQKIETEAIAKPKDESQVKFAFEKARRGSRRVLEAQDIGKSFGDRILFAKSSFYIKHGEKVGVYGPNGCGKTTLIKAILGEENLTGGELFLSPSLHIGYLNQDIDDLDGEMKVAEILDIDKSRYPGPVVTLLVNLGLSVNILRQQVKTLSIGERRKIKLARLVQQPNDLLILDEPGNHLDMHSREELEQTLQEYNGTILLVSHDRYMLQKVCDTMLIIENQHIKRINGSLEALSPQYNHQGQTGGRKQADDKDIQAEILLAETRLAYLLGEILRYKPGQAEYEKADVEIRELMKVKDKRLTN